MPIYSNDSLAHITALEGVLAAYAVSTSDQPSSAFVGDESLLPIIKACEWLTAFPVTPRPESGKPARARATIGRNTIVVTEFEDAIVIVAIETSSQAAKSLNRSIERLHRGHRRRGPSTTRSA